MKLSRMTWLGAVSFVLFLQTVSGQSFVNLNFEQARFYVSPTPVNGYGGFIDPALAFSGWTVGNSSNGGFTYVFYNNYTLGSPGVDLMGPHFPNVTGYSPLQGSYSALLQYSSIPSLGLPTLSQTGLVPASAQSISFLVGNGISDAAVTLNGVNIPLVPVSGGRLAGDISSFAGSVAQLTFSTSTNRVGDNYLYFDDIQFSSSPVPEPASFVLFGLGVLVLGWKFFVYSYYDAMNKRLDA
jgi:hypothetical protein